MGLEGYSLGVGSVYPEFFGFSGVFAEVFDVAEDVATAVLAV